MCKVNEQPAVTTTHSSGSWHQQVSFTLQPEEVQRQTASTHTREVKCQNSHIHRYVLIYFIHMTLYLRFFLLTVLLCEGTVII